MTCAQSKLSEHFAELAVWRKVQRKEALSCDSLAIICLKITSILVNDDVCRTIARSLSLIFDSKVASCAESELRESFAVAEKSLEENLRGFSGLLDWVLEEGEIRRDAAVLLELVPDIDDNLKKHFHDLATCLDAYLDLKDVFDISAQNALAVFFLVTLEEIFNEESRCGSDVVNEWLVLRVGDEKLAALYNNKSWRDRLPIEGSGHHVKELLVLTLCYKAAKSIAVTSAEMFWLDNALSGVGMLGLQPFVESGFLACEEDAINDTASDEESYACTSIKIVKRS